jgi:hypothetical protein
VTLLWLLWHSCNTPKVADFSMRSDMDSTIPMLGDWPLHLSSSTFNRHYDVIIYMRNGLVSASLMWFFASVDALTQIASNRSNEGFHAVSPRDLSFPRGALASGMLYNALRTYWYLHSLSTANILVIFLQHSRDTCITLPPPSLTLGSLPNQETKKSRQHGYFQLWSDVTTRWFGSENARIR